MLFYVWEDARVWTYWDHSFHVLLGYLESVSCIILHSCPSPQLLSACRREWLQLDGCYVIDIVLPGCLPGSEIHTWRARITDDCDILVYWYVRIYPFLPGSSLLSPSFYECQTDFLWHKLEYLTLLLKNLSDSWFSLEKCSIFSVIWKMFSWFDFSHPA